MSTWPRPAAGLNPVYWNPSMPGIGGSAAPWRTWLARILRAWCAPEVGQLPPE